MYISNTWPRSRSLFILRSLIESVRPTDKSLSDSPVANEVTVSIVRVTFSESLIDSAQVQVDSIIQVDSTL